MEGKLWVWPSSVRFLFKDIQSKVVHLHQLWNYWKQLQWLWDGSREQIVEERAKWPWAAHSAPRILPVQQYSWNIYLYQSLNGKWNLENKKIKSFLPEFLCLALIDHEISPHFFMCTGLLGAEERLCFKTYGPRKNRELLSSMQIVFFFLKAQREKSPQGSSFVFFFLHSKFSHTSALC